MKTSIQRLALVLCMFVIAQSMLQAQSFSASITPASKIIPINQSATYTIGLAPENDYKATIYLSVEATTQFYGTMKLSSSEVNYPYANATLTITPTLRDTGTIVFKITAKNGAVQSSPTCTMSIIKSAQWSSVRPADQMGWNGSPNGVSLQLNTDGNVSYVVNPNTYPTQEISINQFTNQQWVSNQFQTPETFFTSFNIPFKRDIKGNYWFITRDGIIHYDGNFVTKFNSSNSNLPSGQITALEIDKNGFPVCSIVQNTELIISRFDGVQWTSSTLTKPSISSEVVWNGYLSIDSTNQIWTTTYGGGIMAINGATQQNYNTNSTIPMTSNNTSRILTDLEGKVWCMYNDKSRNIAFAYFNGQNWQDITSPTSSTLETFFVDDNNIWLSSKEGLHWYNGTSWMTYNSSNSPLQFGPKQMIQDKNKNIWMVIGNLFYVFNPNGLVDIPLAPTSVEEQPVITDGGVTISPNPVSENFTILGVDDISSVTIVNSLGMEVKTLNGSHALDVSDLASGFYFVQIRTPFGMITKSIVVSR